MSSKSRDQKRVRALQTKTGWSYSECLRLVRDQSLSDAAVDALIAIRATPSPSKGA